MKHLWQAITQNILAPSNLNREQFTAILAPLGRTRQLKRHAASVIIARVQLLSALFALLVPAWSIVDLLVFDAATARAMVFLRIASAVAFTALAWPRELSADAPYRQSLLLLFCMLMVPPLFYLLSTQFIHPADLNSQQHLLAELYAYMPTIVLGGLSIFPLTALETLVLALPVIGTAAAGLLLGGTHFSLAQHGSTLWFMVMMVGVAMFSGMSQCHYMATLVQKATTDPLTGAYTRHSGCEALDLLFRLTSLGDKPMTVIFLDIDHFKSINDEFGHDAGDRALQVFAEGIRTILRRSDLLIRWGGEEFIILLPDTPVANLQQLLTRLRHDSFGLRPDGRPVTASIGVAESSVDDAANWQALVALADQRMYQAKHQGRDCVVLPDASRLHLAEA